MKLKIRNQIIRDNLKKEFHRNQNVDLEKLIQKYELHFGTISILKIDKVSSLKDDITIPFRDS